MSKLRRMVGNTFISLLGQAVTWSSTLLLTMAYGRFLGDAEFGKLYFAISFVALVGFPVESGFNQQITRDVAQDHSKASRYLANTILIKLLLWGTLYSGILLLAWVLGYTSDVRNLIAICGFSLLSGSLATTFGSLHYAFERVTFPVIGTILEKGLSAAIGIILLKFGAGVQTMALVLLGGSLISTLWQGYWFFRLVGWGFTIDTKLIRNLLKTSIPFLTYGVLGVIYYRLDTVLLSEIANTTVVGWYGAAYRVFDTLVFLPSLFVGAIVYPVLSKLSAGSTGQEHHLKLAIEKCLNFLLFCSMPIATLLITAAPAIVGFLYHSPEFVHTIPALQALAPGLVFLYANSLFASTIISTHHEKRITIMAGVALVFNLGLNVFLIPRYQHVGAAWVTTLTELLLLVLSIAFTPRHLLPAKSLWVCVKVLLACAVMAVVLWLLRDFSLLLVLPASGIAYLASALLLNAIPREDLQTLYRAIRKKAEKNSDAEMEGELVGTGGAIVIEHMSATDFSLAAFATAKIPITEVPFANMPPIEEMATAQIPILNTSYDPDATIQIPRIKRIPVTARPTVKLPAVQSVAVTGRPSGALSSNNQPERQSAVVDAPTMRLPRLHEHKTEQKVP
jgi:O-antigen/teichoic acid export membrane protein